ncbi:Hypothetical protein KVN_LOCUS422, partial [uncultured virus]
VTNLKKKKKTKANLRKLWVNIVLVLDRPLIDNITFDELVANNEYPLLENSINDLNEHKLFMVYLTIMVFYIENGKQILGFTEEEKLKITIHVHQDKKCERFIELLITHLIKFIEFVGNELIINNPTIELEFKTDDVDYLQTPNSNYKDTNILISLSQCAGLDPSLQSGSIILPNQFIRYNVLSKKIRLGKDSYTVENDVVNRIDEIIESSLNSRSLEYINDYYKSYNPSKNINHKAEILVRNDFNFTKILQVEKLWNPIDKNEDIHII